MKLQLSLNNWHNYYLLMRMDRPIGSYLLLWPTLWALLMAAQGLPSFMIVLVFVAGVFLMRSAGCIINDYADRHFDGDVERTQGRPIVTGAVTPTEALQLFAVLIVIAFLLVLTMNTTTILLSFPAVLLASSYPFMKRYTHFPQVVLGAAYGWAIPMSIAAVTGSVPMWGWLLFLANLLWTVAYDTMYAMVDRNDDLKIGVKSTAVLFGQYDKAIIGLLQLMSLLLLIVVAQINDLGFFAYLGIAGMTVLFGYQQYLIKDRAREQCFTAFLNNHYAGMSVAIGIGMHYLIS